MSRPTIGVLIRFKNSAATLPRVLQRLQAQTIQPLFILGVDTGSTDESPALITQAGGRVIAWSQPYHHARVLNYGLKHLHTELVLVLSSHTTLEDDDAVARMLAAFEAPRVACVSAKWDNDPFYSDAITWEELHAKGLKFGSIYSNSMGMIRRKAWETAPFDESLVTAEDYDWAIGQLQRRAGAGRRDGLVADQELQPGQTRGTVYSGDQGGRRRCRNCLGRESGRDE